jgi:hypothetical protein
MKKWIAFLVALCLPMLGFSFEKLNEKYLTTFGDAQTSIHITQYFSMTCPHCLSLFKKDFKEIKTKYLDTKKASWTFHPVPLDSLTIQVMDCLSKLSSRQKVILLEALFDTLQVQDGSEVVLFLMQEAMKTFRHPIPELDEKEYITKTEAFWDAFAFIKQEDRLDAVPAVEINGIQYPREIPHQAFIEKQMEKLSHD